METIHVGFTGTQKGMSQGQKDALMSALLHLRIQKRVILHHGDCIGADFEAAQIAEVLAIRTELHPPENPSKRAFCKADVVYPVMPYLVRNHHIVDASEFLYAAPFGPERLRSGTWATVRYARTQGKWIVLLDDKDRQS